MVSDSEIHGNFDEKICYRNLKGKLKCDKDTVDFQRDAEYQQFLINDVIESDFVLF